MKIAINAATNVKLLKATANKQTLTLNALFEFDVPQDVMNNASRIITQWLNRVRKVLRVHGSTKDYPLLTQDDVTQWKKDGAHRQHPQYSTESVILPLAKLNPKLDPVLDVIMPCKVDIESASAVLNRVKWGDQQWKNVADRVRKEFKPLVVAHLLQVSGKMEDSSI